MKRYKPKNRPKDIVSRPETLCWRCAKSVNMGCSWSQGFKPVYGWTAVPTKITCADHTADSYRVVDCPEFERG